MFGGMCHFLMNVPFLDECDIFVPKLKIFFKEYIFFVWQEVKYGQYECQKAMLDFCKKVNYLTKIWATEKNLTFLLGGVSFSLESYNV